MTSPSSELDAALIQYPETAFHLDHPSEIRNLSHRLSASFPSPAADYAQNSLDITSYLIHNKPATFIFTVKGDSMMGAHIVDGDKVIVDRSANPKHQDIVVAVVDGQYTIKRLHHKNGLIQLHPENVSYPVITFAGGTELEIWGVVTGVIRRYTKRA